MAEYRSHGHSISKCQYHFVWCPKYRHAVLDSVRDELVLLFHETAERFGHEIIALEIASDHVHLFVEADARWSPAEIAKQFKGYSGQIILSTYPVLREKFFWDSGFWKSGYYVGPTGSVSAEVVQEYIERVGHE